jgi:hypothetical protein
MKQTAVEFLEEKLLELFGDHLPFELLDEAKEMEKQQIMNAANTLLYHSTGPGDTAAEQYYNETFKK